jgi:hypothetical protein
MLARRARVRVAACVGLERRSWTPARCGHCSTCASDQMLRRIVPTAERTVTRGGNKKTIIDKGGAIRERPFNPTHFRAQILAVEFTQQAPFPVMSPKPKVALSSAEGPFQYPRAFPGLGNITRAKYFPSSPSTPLKESPTPGVNNNLHGFLGAYCLLSRRTAAFCGQS